MVTFGFARFDRHEQTEPSENALILVAVLLFRLLHDPIPDYNVTFQPIRGTQYYALSDQTVIVNRQRVH